MRTMRSMLYVTTAALLLVHATTAQTAVGTAFSLQGVLKDDQGPVTGTDAADMQFKLFAVESGGTPIAGPISVNGVDFGQDGGFTVLVDFGQSAFGRSARWLEIAVAAPPGSPFITLITRQRILPAPVAQVAGSLQVDTIYGPPIDCVSRGFDGAAELEIDNPDNDAPVVLARTNSDGGGAALRGAATDPVGLNYGVFGSSASPSGYAGYFQGRGYFSGNVGIGDTAPSQPLTVSSPSAAPAANSVLAILSSTNSGSQSAAVFGINAGTAGDCLEGMGVTRYGVWGSISSCAGAGVYGQSLSNSAGYGVHGVGFTGIYGTSSAANGFSGYFDNGRVYVNERLGIGAGSQAFAYQLKLSQNSAAKPTSSAWTIDSDARLKKNVQTLVGSLEKLLRLRGVSYQWIDPASQGNMAGTYAGMIAQEVECVFPDWVDTDARGYKNLTPIGFEGLTVEALRDLRTEKDEQIAALRRELVELRNVAEQRAKAMEAENAQLRDRLNRIESLVRNGRGE